MMGIKVNEPTFIFGDNKSVLYNTTSPGSTLKKKSNAIAYHFVREGVARAVKFAQMMLQNIYPVTGIGLLGED